jgi:hypothetical protein
MVEVGDWSLPTKVHPLKKTQSKKTRQRLIGNLIPDQTQSSFSTSGFFLYVNFCGQFLLAKFFKTTVNTAKYAETLYRS